MKDFFLYKMELPEDGGFEMFGTCHLFWLIGIGIFSWWLGRFFSFATEAKKNQVRRLFGVVFPGIAILREIVLWVTGHLEPDMYPLHLCNLSLWVGFVYIWWHSRFAGVVYVLLCLPAAALALVFPGWTRYPLGTFMHIHDFVFHGLVVAFGWSLVRSKEIVPQWKELWQPLLFGVIGCVIMYYVNCVMGTNFWFVNKPSDGSPLSWIYSSLGDSGYKVGLFLFCAQIVIVWCIIIRIYVNLKERKADKYIG